MSETLSAEELANTVWIDNDGYPTEAALEAVATLPSPQVFEVMRRAWWMPTHGVRNDLSAAEAEMVGELEGTPWRLATGGWSGNEELIDAFQESWSWRWTWRLTAAGGLYIFDAPAKELPGGRVAPLGKAATIEALQRELEESRSGCPCEVIEPCDQQCTCVNPFSSYGCTRCAKYGSLEQRKAAAHALAQLPAEVTTLRTALERIAQSAKALRYASIEDKALEASLPQPDLCAPFTPAARDAIRERSTGKGAHGSAASQRGTRGFPDWLAGKAIC